MSASRVKRNDYKINKEATATVTYAGPDAPQFEFPPQLKPVRPINERLIDAGSVPPVTNGVPLYCNQRGNEDRIYKAPIEDFRMRLRGEELVDQSHLSYEELLRLREPGTMKENQYDFLLGQKRFPFQLGLKVDGLGRPLNPSAL